MAMLFKNIKALVNTREFSQMLKGKYLAELPTIFDAYLFIENDVIIDFGSMQNLPAGMNKIPEKEIINVQGRYVLPTWCDSHTHIVYDGSREDEFIDKIKGLNYAEIAARGGGILNSARNLQNASEDALFSQAWQRLDEVSKLGTGAIEIKSGYGLTVESELKMLRVIKKLKEKSGLIIKSTFLGAHTYPAEFKENHQGYIDMIIHEMLPVIARERLADYIDVFF